LAGSAGDAERAIVKRLSPFLIAVLCLGYAFFYVPILSMIVYSFNKSRLATVWGGFSTQWYGRLLKNDQVIDAALLSLGIAVVSATVATVLGVMAGMALARFKRFPGRTAFSGLVTSPLIMPEVITGISLALLFINLSFIFGQRGATTITIAHITFSMSYVATIVQSRLSSMDRSVEEAAMDLGSKPAQVLFDVTLPIIAPAIVSGWLLAFTLSLDDVVITNFTNGPGSTTLPIYIFSKVRLGVTPDMNALATIIVTIVGAGVALAGLILYRAEKRRERDVQMAIAANK
jgi:putrescine transport system permease protein